MPLDPPRLLALLGLAAVAGADAAAAGQLMIGQPLVCGWLAGSIVGQPHLGLFLGMALQLLWSRVAPVGAAAYPDVGPGAVAGVGAAGLCLAPASAWRFDAVAPFPGGPAAAAALLGLTVALLTGWLGQRTTVAMRRGNARLAAAADEAAAKGSFGGLEWCQARGLARAAGLGLIVAAAGLTLGAAGARVLSIVGSLSGGGPASGGSAGLTLFWWFALAAAATSLWRRPRVDLWLVGGGLLLGLLIGRLR